MKILERPLKAPFVVANCWIILAISQIIINSLNHNPPIFVIFFSMALAINIVIAILTGIDLFRKEVKIITGKVVHVEEYRIHILKSNGKIKKVRVKAAEFAQFHVEQALEMHWTRCSGLLIAIHKVDNET